MKTKLFEVRDRGTFLPVVAIQCDPSCESERYLLARTGYSTRPETQKEYILLASLSGGSSPMHCDPYSWGVNPRTRHIAHKYIIENFDRLSTGDVVCVETILGERSEPKRSERFSEPH